MRIPGYFQNLQIRQAKFLDSNVMEFSKMTCKPCLQAGTETQKVRDVRGVRREYIWKPLKHSIVKRILVFKQ